MRAFGWRVVALAALLLVGLPLSGCEWRQFTVRIPDFDSKQVEGIWVWRYSEQTGRFERDGEIILTEPFLADGVEQLLYLVKMQGDTPDLQIPVFVARNPLNPDEVTLRLQYPRYTAAGEFRVSSYNAVGESPLSAESAWF